jgi:hypothetical protein
LIKANKIRQLAVEYKTILSNIQQIGAEPESMEFLKVAI